MTGPAGSFNGAWGWKDDKYLDSCFDAALNFRLNLVDMELVIS